MTSKKLYFFEPFFFTHSHIHSSLTVHIQAGTIFVYLNLILEMKRNEFYLGQKNVPDLALKNIFNSELTLL